MGLGPRPGHKLPADFSVTNYPSDGELTDIWAWKDKFAMQAGHFSRFCTGMEDPLKLRASCSNLCSSIATGATITALGGNAEMAYTRQDLSPYSSHLMATKSGPIADIGAEIQNILELAMIHIGDAMESERRVTGGAKATGNLVSADFIAPWSSTLRIAPAAASGAPPATMTLHSVACVYEEDRPVIWLPSIAGRDRLHHLLMVSATDDGLLLLTTTDAEHRAVVLTHLKSGTFSDWKPVPQSVLIKALVEGQKMRTLWLAGIHRNNAIKPSSKILSGSDLADAIDPMNDSSYLAGAVRSTRGGVSLRNSSAWTGPNSTLVSFEERGVEVMSQDVV